MNYYQFLKAKVACSACGWSGTGKETTKGELFRDLYEYHCPSCGVKVGVCAYPTTAEARANWALVPENERRHIEKVEEAQARMKECSLKAARELPDLGAEPIVVAWDFEDDEKSVHSTVLRHGDRILWREPAVYEGVGRFKEVVAILMEKYGRLLKDVIPTPRSELYLYGDSYSAPDDLESVRKRVREAAESGGSAATAKLA